MENGYLILGILAVLFLGMYGYSYIPVVLEERKQKRLEIEQEKLEQIRQEEKIKNQELRDEKLRKVMARSAEIQEELKRLEQNKKYRKNLDDTLVNQLKVDKMKKQQAG